jgi:prepilin-type processing-associated H-X9-DG protein
LYLPKLAPTVKAKDCLHTPLRRGLKIIVGDWLSNHQRIVDGDAPAWWGWAGRRNFLFVDGQVRFLDANDIRPANDGNPNPNLTTHGIKGSDWPR